MTKYLLAALAALMLCVGMAAAQDSPLQTLMQEHRALIEKASRKTIEPAIAALRDSGLPEAQTVLEKWQAKELWQRKEDGLFFFAEKLDGSAYQLIDIAGGGSVGEAEKSDLKQLKPNSGVRSLIGAALVQFQLLSPDRRKRVEALDAIQRDPAPEHLEALAGAIEEEPDAEIRARKERLVQLLTISFSDDETKRIEAINAFAGDTGVDARAALNPLLATTREAVAGDIPDGVNVANTLKPGQEEFSKEAAYDLLVTKDLAPRRISTADKRAALEANIVDGRVGGVPLAQLNTDGARERAYANLAEAGVVPPTATEAEVQAALDTHSFYDRYAEASIAVTDAARATLTSINTRVGLNQAADLTLDALSLASIYFLAAIGLAITFGVMGVINMAHGEFIMMGAYTGYVVQQVIPDYTVSILVALPLAFAVTFAAGVAMERLVIRWLYNRPLETLLATFGISIALQQLAKNIFGTQARPLTSPSWLDGALVFNDVVSISYIRIAIFVLALIFLGVFLFIMRRTRLGLEVRAVTQNPAMAASMGINPDRINMLTFGLGSGIAGIAGVAIGLYAKVTSELGSDYIVQSFMTVVVGGVGNIWGTLLGATMIGFLQKGIEWMNPSNTLAAQTYMIIFIIIFIQFRPRGIIALKGRAAGD
ncbi:urea ABC transporter permease subunit UrtB [Tropicimonas marinistellae]|uniref:urea ABC transporter permease subunit UrtB n=1 Tax=Tropicimonas marinistellae TaxID=1739787 RepID=UPI0008307D54|nr:urea ABC transporter permease subunit UrtB [Tropicimonas marinistellae]